MKRVEIMREQGAILRSLAASFDDPKIKADLLGLAAQCDQLAEEATRIIVGRLQMPIDPKPSG
jgi:hypothetical protein